MSALSAAAALAGARIATALLCFVSLWFHLTSVPRAFDAPWLGALVVLYALAALGGFLVFLVSRRQSRAGALAMTGLDCAFLGLMVASGETGAFVLPLAALMARMRGSRYGARAGFAAAALVVAAFVTASLWSQFWSVHLALVVALTAMLMAMVTAPARAPQTPAAAPEVESSPVEATPAAAEAVVAVVAPGSEMKPRRVLVADPVTTSRLILEKILARAGHIVVGAADGAAAMTLLDGHVPPIDALIIAGDLPDMGASELALRIRADERLRALHVIGIATAASSASHEGLDVALARPVDFAMLLEAIAVAPVASVQAPNAVVIDEAPAEIASPPPADADTPETASGEGPAIDLRALRDLESLGGGDFVREIVNQFIVDGAGALRNLARLTVDGDAEMFRDQAHALRSSAANVGARAIYETCLAWRAIEPEQLARDGAMHMRTLNRQFQEATAVLEDYIAQIGDGEADGGAAPAAKSMSDAA